MFVQTQPTLVSRCCSIRKRGLVGDLRADVKFNAHGSTAATKTTDTRSAVLLTTTRVKRMPRVEALYQDVRYYHLQPLQVVR